MEKQTEKIPEWEMFKVFFASRKADLFFLIAAILLGVFLEWDIVEVAIFAVLVWSIIGPISVRILAGVALGFLSIVPFLLFFEREEQAEIYAVYAYYFLVITVIRGIMDLRNEQEVDILADREH